MMPRPLGGEPASGQAPAAHTPHAAAAPKASALAASLAQKPVRADSAPGVRTSFSPQGLQLAAAGADKLGSAAELATQGLGQIGAAAVEGAASTLDAIGESITAGADELGGALRTTISTAALAVIAGAALLGGSTS